jgi:hypothetical protein
LACVTQGSLVKPWIEQSRKWKYLLVLILQTERENCWKGGMGQNVESFMKTITWLLRKKAKTVEENQEEPKQVFMKKNPKKR